LFEKKKDLFGQWSFSFNALKTVIIGNGAGVTANLATINANLTRPQGLAFEPVSAAGSEEPPRRPLGTLSIADAADEIVRSDWPIIRITELSSLLNNRPEMTPDQMSSIAKHMMKEIESMSNDVDRVEAAQTLFDNAMDFPMSAEVRSDVAGTLVAALASINGHEQALVQEYHLRGQSGGSFHAFGELGFVAFALPEYRTSDPKIAPLLTLSQSLVSLTSLLNQRIDFELTALDGETRQQLKTYRGKTVLLNFWATWCPPCRREMPILEKLHQESKDKTFTVLTITDEEPKVVSNYVSANHLTMPILIDPESKVQELYGRRGIPHTVIISPEGKITQQFYGMRSEAEYLDNLRAAGFR